MSCDFYEYQSGFLCGDYYCKIKKDTINSDTYYKYCRGYNYQECPIYIHERNSSSGCFITTVVCNILGKNDDDKVLNNLRSFRDNILVPNKKYHDILKEYDVIGSRVSEFIVNDKDREKMAVGIYENAILPINERINQKDYDTAVEMYYIMTLSLVNYYGLKHDYNRIKDRNYNNFEFNEKTAGHGLRKVRIRDNKENK